MRQHNHHRISALCLAVIIISASDLGLASDAHPEKKSRKQANSTEQTLGKTKFDKGSGETSKERDRRLLRECKGRPNSGACMGYTG